MQWLTQSVPSTYTLYSRLRGHTPGRINLIGEHTDYNGGKVLPFAMQMGMSFILQSSDEQGNFAEMTIELVSRQQKGLVRLKGQEILEILPALHFGDGGEDLRPRLPTELASSWARYALGALSWHAKLLGEQNRLEKRAFPAFLKIEVDADLPAGAGVSSSAALCVGFLVMLDRFQNLGTELIELARRAMYVEHQFAGTRCGLMDQTAVALCEEHKLLMIDFVDLGLKGEVYTKSVQLHPHFDVYRPVLINTRVKHELGNSPYNERRKSCEEGLKQLSQLSGKVYPSFGYVVRDQEFMRTYCPDGEQKSLKQNLAERIFAGDLVRAQRVAHAIMECLRVDLAADALEQGRCEDLKRWILASHESLRDDYEVSCRELDLIQREAIRIAEELGAKKNLSLPILGARMTGGGFGGSTIQLVHSSVLDEFLKAIEDPKSIYAQECGLRPQAIVAEFARGAWVSSTFA